MSTSEATPDRCKTENVGDDAMAPTVLMSAAGDSAPTKALGAVAGPPMAAAQQDFVDVVARASGSLSNSINATENVLAGRISHVQGSLLSITAQLEALQSGLIGLEQRTSAQHGTVANEINSIHNAILLQGQTHWKINSFRDNVSEQIGSFKDHVSQHFGPVIQELAMRVDTLAAQSALAIQHSAARDGAMANEINASLNAVLAQQGSVRIIGAQLDQLIHDIKENRTVDTNLSLLTARSLSSLISGRSANKFEKMQPVVAPCAVLTLDAQFEEFRKIAPVNFPAWEVAYREGIAEGLRSPVGNLSHDGHHGASYFGMYINVHARGRVLDIGCGPIALPSYLNNWPLDALAGMDPQLPFEPHPFAFAQSFAENIPWPNASFETVVIGTSLDHIFLLDQAMAEVKRVLVPRGRLLIWTGMFDSSDVYDPKGAQIKQPDRYHLFHPGRNWFYEMFDRDYRLIECMPTLASSEFLAYELKH